MSQSNSLSLLRTFFLTLVSVLLLAGAAYVAWALIPADDATAEEQPAAQSMPVEDVSANVYVGWETVTDSKAGVSFQYPEDLGTSYLEAFDWPPQVRVLDQAFTCTQGGESEAMPAGQTIEKSIDGTIYCVTKVTESAAGSIYTQYAYAFAHGEDTAILTFSLRFPQCGNYDEEQQAECQAEREAFDVDQFVNDMAQSVKAL